MKRTLIGLALLAACGCQAEPVQPMPELATFQVAGDFNSYDVRRVGLMPFAGVDLDPEQAVSLQMSFLAELGRNSPFEIVLLDRADLEEVQGSEPYRRGWYSPRTIIEISRRYSLDATLFGTVVQHQVFPPQSLSLQMDMVAAETGLVIWSSSLHIDANDERVRRGLELFYGLDRDVDPDLRRDWELALLSPRRFARFAAYQIAGGL